MSITLLTWLQNRGVSSLGSTQRVPQTSAAVPGLQGQSATTEYPYTAKHAGPYQPENFHTIHSGTYSILALPDHASSRVCAVHPDPLLETRRTGRCTFIPARQVHCSSGILGRKCTRMFQLGTQYHRSCSHLPGVECFGRNAYCGIRDLHGRLQWRLLHQLPVDGPGRLHVNGSVFSNTSKRFQAWRKQRF